MSTAIGIGVLLVLLGLGGPVGAEDRNADARSDAFLAGYATSLLERDLGLDGVRVEVEDGTAVVTVRDPGGVQTQQVADVVAQIDGIEHVEVRVDGESSGPVADADEAPSEPEAGWGVELLPRREIFDPLLADPREPRFSASYLWYLGDPELEHVGSANFGESFALLSGPVGGRGARWELGLFGGVYSVFDLDAPSYDLVNSDFLVGPTFSLRKDALSAQVRLYHQSSHLGDEFLLRNRVGRVNLSYEGVDALVSVDLYEALRVYVGGGVIVHDEPELDPWSAQFGIELRSPITFLRGAVRPIAAGDLQIREENDWREEISGVVGVQLENPDLSRLRLQILGEYFRGNSPNGQFFQRRIEYVGVGLHLHF